jgi:hypothetical protein
MYHDIAPPLVDEKIIDVIALPPFVGRPSGCAGLMKGVCRVA